MLVFDHNQYVMIFDLNGPGPALTLSQLLIQLRKKVQNSSALCFCLFLVSVSVLSGYFTSGFTNTCSICLLNQKRFFPMHCILVLQGQIHSALGQKGCLPCLACQRLHLVPPLPLPKGQSGAAQSSPLTLSQGRAEPKALSFG